MDDAAHKLHRIRVHYCNWSIIMAGYFFKRSLFRRKEEDHEKDQEQVRDKLVQCQFCNGYTNTATGYNREEILSVAGGYLHTRYINTILYRSGQIYL